MVRIYLSRCIAVLLAVMVLTAATLVVFVSDAQAQGRGAAQDRSAENRPVLPQERGPEMAQTGLQAQDENEDEDEEVSEETATSSDSQKRGRENLKRASVATEVLLRLADRANGIGPEIREVAHEQASSTERTADALEKIESRNPIVTFLLGTDYRNIGGVRSEMVRTQNHINRLERAKERAVDADVAGELDEQIEALKETASSTESFIREHENRFSLFGWVFRIFNTVPVPAVLEGEEGDEEEETEGEDINEEDDNEEEGEGDEEENEEETE